MGSVTSASRWSGAGLAAASDFVMGGWDISDTDLAESVRQASILPIDYISALAPSLSEVPIYRGHRLTSDFAPANGASNGTARDAVELYRDHIKLFRQEMNVDRLCVIIVLPPEKDIEPQLLTMSSAEFLKLVDRDDGTHVRSGHCYALAAIQEGCGVVDFTPSSTLETSGIVDLARDAAVPLAGRDGSTGQTMLKLWLAELFRARGLDLRGWYSTNIIGNPDGLALSAIDRRAIKIIDKTDGLNFIYPEAAEDHVVSIEFFRPSGDNKESWDAIELSGWFDLSIRLRIDWQGRDSVLAAPLLYDLSRLMSDNRAWACGGGVLKEARVLF